MTTHTGINAANMLTSIFFLSGTAPDYKTSQTLLAIGNELAKDMDPDDARGAYEDAKALLGVEPPDPATCVDLPAPPTLSNDKLIGRIDAIVRARNDAHEAQQRFADAHVVTEPDSAADALYEATYELVHRIDTLLDSVEWQNIMLSL